MSQTDGQSAKRSAWNWFGIITAIAGSITVMIGNEVGNQKAGSSCGTVFNPNNLTAEYYDAMTDGGNSAVTSCNQGIASMAVQTWFLIVLGIVLVLTAIIVWVIVWAVGNSRPAAVAAAPAAPSVATQLEELSRLKEQGLITTAEFDAKRAELVNRL